MIQQIKAQLNASLENIDRSSKIENLCSKLSATLAMCSALDKNSGLVGTIDSYFDYLYIQVMAKVDTAILKIQDYGETKDTAE